MNRGYDAEKFAITADGSFHSLKDLATQSFSKGNSKYIRYDSLLIAISENKGSVKIKFNENEVDTPVLYMGGGFPTNLTFSEKFKITVADIFVEALTDAEIQIFGNGLYKN